MLAALKASRAELQACTSHTDIQPPYDGRLHMPTVPQLFQQKPFVGIAVELALAFSAAFKRTSMQRTFGFS